MKKISFLIIVASLILSSKNKNAAGNHSIVGTWKPIEMNVKRMSASEKQDMIDHTVIEFSSDNKIHTEQGPTIMNGTYTLSGDSLMVSLKESTPHKFMITWDADKMIMTDEDGSVKLINITGQSKKADKPKDNSIDELADESSALVGHWKPAEIGVPDLSDSEKSEMMNEMSIEFTNDGKYYSTEKDRKRNATYSYDKATHLVKFTETGTSGDPFSHELKLSWDGDKMVLTNEEGWVKFKKQ